MNSNEIKINYLLCFCALFPPGENVRNLCDIVW